MKRAIAGAYFAVLCLHCVSWLRMVVWPNAGTPDVLELLGILVAGGTPLVFLGALLGLVAPRMPVALIAGLIVLTLFADVARGTGTIPALRHLEGAIATVSLLLGLVGLVVVVRSGRSSSIPGRRAARVE